MSTIVVTGANGLLGSIVCKVFKAAGHTVTGIDIEHADISRGDEIIPLMTSLAPHLVIHCAALTNLDVCEAEPDKAYLVNTVGTRNIAQACTLCNAELLYISTDYVFGKNATRPLLEWDAPDPLNEYARSKYAGEEYVRMLSQRFYIVRIAGLFGMGGKNFIDTILKLARERASVTVIDDQVSNKTYAPDLADALLALTTKHQYGIYHIANEGACSWYQFAVEAVTQSGLDPAVLKPISAATYGGVIARPAYSVFNMIAYRSLVGHSLPHYSQALTTFLNT